MIKKSTLFKYSLIAWVLFILFAIFFTLNGNKTNEQSQFIVNGIGISLFLLSLNIFQRFKVKNVLLSIGCFQLILVFFLLQFYWIEYNNPWGYEPVDAKYYHDLASYLQRLKLNEVTDFLSKNLAMGDYGYPFILQLVYRFSGDFYPIEIARILGVIVHIITSFYVFKSTLLLTGNWKTSKMALIFYGFFPSSIFYITSGLKEPFFTLLIILSFYHLLKASIKSSKLSFIYGLMFAISTGFFRSAFPIFIIFSFLFYSIIGASGKYKLLKRIGLLSFGAVILFFAYLIIQSELLQKINYDNTSIATYRLGKEPSIVDYSLMAIGGVIGPYPTFDFSVLNQNTLLQTSFIYLKLFFSYFLLVGIFISIKLKHKILYMLYTFIIINIIVLTTLAATLDYRFLYPMTPLMFIIISYGMSYKSEFKLPKLLYARYYFIAIIVLITLFNFTK